MGSPVFRGGGAFLTSGTKTVFGFTPRATTRWRSTIVTCWREPFVAPESSGSPNFGEVTLAVAGSNVFETRILNSSHGPNVLVLPLWGMRFSGSQKAVWTLASAGQCQVHASWQGEED